jgi:uncharacterized protein (DUF1499 family)
MSKLSFLVAVVAALMVLLPGPLFKYDWLALGPAFASLRLGVYVGFAALAVFVVQLLFFRKTLSLLVGVLSLACIGLAVGVPLAMKSKASSVPPIHDITTDIARPPEFIAVLSEREGARNPAEYAGEDVALQQQKAYPDLDSQQFDLSAESVQQAAKSVINGFGWTLHENSKGYNLEATHQSTWFGFKDDIIVRIEEQNGRTVVDIRSKSRIGRSDLGANASRIRSLQDALASAVEEKMSETSS